MFGIFADIVGKARPDSSIWSKAGPSETPEQDQVPESTLFQCRSCGNVYVAVEKTECGSCDGSIIEINDSIE